MGLKVFANSVESNVWGNKFSIKVTIIVSALACCYPLTCLSPIWNDPPGGYTRDLPHSFLFFRVLRQSLARSNAHLLLSSHVPSPLSHTVLTAVSGAFQVHACLPVFALAVPSSWLVPPDTYMMTHNFLSFQPLLSCYHLKEAYPHCPVQIASPPYSIYFFIMFMVCLLSLECMLPPRPGQELFLFCSQIYSAARTQQMLIHFCWMKRWMNVY